MKYDCKATVLSCVGGILHAGEYVELRIYSALKAGWASHRAEWTRYYWTQYYALEIFKHGPSFYKEDKRFLLPLFWNILLKIFCVTSRKIQPLKSIFP